MTTFAIKTVGKATIFLHRELFHGDSYRVTFKAAGCIKSASGDSPLEALEQLIYSFGFDEEGNQVKVVVPRDIARLLAIYQEVK